MFGESYKISAWQTEGNAGYYNAGSYNRGQHNTGHINYGEWNSGNKNTGINNSGDLNFGDFNSGDFNSGSYNAGNYNAGDFNSGMFNSVTPVTIKVFNQDCDLSAWNAAPKPLFIQNVSVNRWIPSEQMNASEKASNPRWDVAEGFVKNITYQEAWQEAYSSATPGDIIKLKNLPNWDASVFEDITGIIVP